MEKTRQIVGLDYLRFVAAFLVMSFHLSFYCWIANYSNIGADHGVLGHVPHGVQPLPLAEYGWVGVRIFFVISGFVIAYTANGASVFQYLKSRVVRLFPAAWICATMTAGLYFYLGTHGATEVFHAYLRSLLLYNTGSFVDGAYWTLTVEINFYAVIAVFLLINAFNRAEFVISAIGLLSSLILVIGYLADRRWIASGMAPMPYSIFGTYLWGDLLLYFPFFATGIVLWGAMRRGYTLPRVLALIILTMGGAVQIVSDTKIQPGVYVSTWGAVCLYLAGLTFIILSVEFNSRFPRRFSREIGLATYPLYLLHNVLGAFVLGRMIKLFPSLNGDVDVFLAMAIILIVVFAAIRPLEAQAQKLLRNAISLVGRIMDSGSDRPTFLTRATSLVE